MKALFAALTFTLCTADFVANVVKYGALGDGKTLDTAAIQAAVADISSHGGGTLYFPPGKWLSAPFNLTSNLALVLDSAYLLASTNMSLWPLIAPLPSYGQGRDHTSTIWERYGAFIGAYNVSNITITTNSTGVIHGQGYPWWLAHEAGTLCCTPGHLIEVAWSSNINIGAPVGYPSQALTLWNSPFWHVHLYSVDNAWVHDLHILADPLYGNTDGVDPDSATNVLIERVHYFGGDDGVAVKSGWDQAGIDYAQPTVNVTVRDSVFSTRASCVCIGSEMSGGVVNVTAYNITCSGTATGAYVKSAPGRGGYVTNFTFRDSHMQGVATGIALSLGYGDHPDGKPVNMSALPALNGFYFSGITGEGIASAGAMVGMTAAPWNDVQLSDVDMGSTAGGWVCSNVTGSAIGVYPAPCSELNG